MEELDRDGITIDRCRSCRGIWLDRGELERLTARGRGGEYGDRRDDFDEDSDAGGRRQGSRRSSWWEIFD
jgi:hypothetical protein